MRSLENAIERLAEPILLELGLELVDLDLTRRGRKLWVVMYIDRINRENGGVSINELSDFNLAMSRTLDVEEPVPETYTLEVSSPGLNRRIRKLKDFVSVLGRKVTVIRKEAAEGRRKFTGVLEGADEEGVTLSIEGTAVRIPHGLIEKANLIHEFEVKGREKQPSVRG